MAAAPPMRSRHAAFAPAPSWACTRGRARARCALRMADGHGAPVGVRGRRAYLERFVAEGPVFGHVRRVAVDEWVEMGAVLEGFLGDVGAGMDVRVYHYYLPVFFWIRSMVASVDGPCVLGFSCPQGGGKTTMTGVIEAMLKSCGLKVAIASLDDFYVTNDEQRKLAEQHAGNPLMEFRGMPGTHDVPLLLNTLDALRAGDNVDVPRYDKTAHNGRGDRAPRSAWARVFNDVDVVLLEGWCMGFRAAPVENVADPNLHVVNEELRRFEDLYERLHGMLVVEVQDMNWVYGWRLQAERGSRNEGKPGLSDEQVVDFVNRFMPAYKQYSPSLYELEQHLFPGRELHIRIDQARRPIPKR